MGERDGYNPYNERKVYTNPAQYPAGTVVNGAPTATFGTPPAMPSAPVVPGASQPLAAPKPLAGVTGAGERKMARGAYYTRQADGSWKADAGTVVPDTWMKAATAPVATPYKPPTSPNQTPVSWIPPAPPAAPNAVPAAPPSVMPDENGMVPEGDPSPISTTTTPEVSTTAGVEAYMNPYRQQVLDPALREMDAAAAKRRSAIGSEAYSSGAFGDARHGIEGAELTKDLLRGKSDLTAQINANAYDQGMSWLNTDTDRALQMALANAGLNTDWLTSSLGNLGTFGSGLMGLDAYDRDYAQGMDEVAYQDWLAKQGWDENRISTFMNLINLMPGQGGTQTTSSSPNNQWANTLGALLGSMGGGGGGNWLTGK